MKFPTLVSSLTRQHAYSASDLLSWWRRGLLCCLPFWLRKHLDPAATPYILAVDQHGARLSVQREEGLREIQRFTIDHARSLLSGSEIRNLVLRVPSDWVLTKRLRLPSAAKENLREVVGYEMDRHTPFSAHQVYYDVKTVRTVDDGRQMEVDIAVLPRERVKEWIAAVRGLKAGLIRIDSVDLWERGNMLPLEEQPRATVAERSGDLLLWAVVVVLLAAVFVTPLWQKRQMALALEAQLDKIKTGAGEVLVIQEKVDKSRASLSSVVDMRAKRPFAVDLLKRITEILPDDTWVQQFELKDGRVELRGMSDQATALIGLIESAPDFENAVFRSPVIQVQGQERFHLSAELSLSGGGE